MPAHAQHPWGCVLGSEDNALYVGAGREGRSPNSELKGDHRAAALGVVLTLSTRCTLIHEVVGAQSTSSRTLTGGGGGGGRGSCPLTSIHGTFAWLLQASPPWQMAPFWSVAQPCYRLKNLTSILVYHYFKVFKEVNLYNIISKCGYVLTNTNAFVLYSHNLSAQINNTCTDSTPEPGSPSNI